MTTSNRWQAWLSPPKALWIVGVLACLLYANTLGHEYTQDDAIVIYDNMYVDQGISGIPGLLTKDTFHGFFKTDGKDKLVKGGRYRPLTPIMFVVERTVFGKNPWVGHFFNIAYYAFLGIIMYLVLYSLLGQDQRAGWIALAATCLYVAHPLHTEAVANIKGRDEIVALIGSLGAFWFLLKYVDKHSKKYLFWAGIAFFLGLMSKENTITFLAVIPVGLMLFKQTPLPKTIKLMVPLILATIIFIAIRTAVLGVDFGGTSFELMNNPFLKIEGGKYVPFTTSERLGTIMVTLWEYLSLLIFPHPLTHDYYPRQIAMQSMENILPIISLGLHMAMVFGVFYFWKKKPIVAWSLLFYIATLSIVSNIVFPIGTNMSERFLFMPSMAYALLLGSLLWYLNSRGHRTLALSMTGVLLLGFSYKTISRNMVWKNDFTLFTTDVKTSRNSAKVLNAAGGALTTEASKLDAKDPKRKEMLAKARGYLTQALEVHPNYANAALLLGNASYYEGNYEAAVQAYQRVLSINPNDADANRNLAVALRDAGRVAGEEKQDFAKSIKYLKQSYNLVPDDLETVRLLGVAHGVSGDPKGAIPYFEILVKANPDNPGLLRNLGTAYMQSGDVVKGQELLAKAQMLDPK